MAPKLKENLIAEYTGAPNHAELHRLAPDFAEQFYDLATVVPEYGVWEDSFEDQHGKIHQLAIGPTKRAIAQILGIFYRDIDKKAAYSDAQIKRNIAAHIIRFHSRLAQIGSSQTLHGLRAVHEAREQLQVQAEREAILKGEKKLHYLPRIIEAPFIPTTDECFRRFPANFAKMIQARLSNPTDRFNVLDEREAQKPETLRDMILDPGLMTDRQVENLCIDVPWNRRKLSSLEKIEYKASMTDRLKDELGVLRRLDSNSPDTRDTFGRHRLYATRDGYVLKTTNINGEKPTIAKALLKDADSSGEHTLTNGRQESRGLSRLMQKLLRFHQQLGKDWQPARDEEQIQEVKTQLEAELEQLDNVKNAHKIAARELIQKALQLGATYTHTFNRGTAEVREVAIKIPRTAKCAELIAANTRLQQRLVSGGRRIPRYIANDRAILQEEIGRHEAIPFSKLLAHLEQKDKGRNSVLDAREMNQQQKERVQRLIEGWQRAFNPDKFTPPLLEPYRSFATATHEELAKVQTLMQFPRPTLGDLKDSLDGLHSSLFLHRVWKQWENLYSSHLGNNRIPKFPILIADLNRLVSSLPEENLHQNDPNFSALQAYKAATKEVIETCREGTELSSQEGESQESKKALKKVCKKLKKQMRQVDIVKLLNPISAVPPTLPSLRDGMPEQPTQSPEEATADPTEEK